MSEALEMTGITSAERTVLRDLAERLAEAAADTTHEERRELWYAQNALTPIRPPVLVIPEGGWQELLPVEVLICVHERARGVEMDLRRRIYTFEHFDDDHVTDAEYGVRYAVTNSDLGVEPQWTKRTAPRGAVGQISSIRTMEDIERIKTRVAVHDPEATERLLNWHEEIFGDILRVKLSGHWWWGVGIIDDWMALRGIEQTYWDMMDNPEMVHAGMRRLMEGKLAWIEQLESLGVLSLNNGNEYIASGGLGFTHELPQPDYTGHVRLKDMWGFAETQTMSEVSPAMHDEFVLPYQLPLLERFGLNAYGCCEPLDQKLDLLLSRVPRLRRISISPFADVRVSAERLGNRAIFSWKPNPACLAAIRFDEDAVRHDIRETLEVAAANGCAIEMILKDTHTCNQQPERFDIWARIAMEEACRAAS